jgi:uncharacterized protein YbgA (DUF1722 family)
MWNGSAENQGHGAHARQRAFVPLGVPLALTKHYVTTLHIGHIRNQVYLSPHPMELMLRNCVMT